VKIGFSFLELAEGFEPPTCPDTSGLLYPKNKKPDSVKIGLSFLELAEGFEPPTCPDTSGLFCPKKQKTRFGENRV
jgi:hypothetical protein